VTAVVGLVAVLALPSFAKGPGELRGLWRSRRIYVTPMMRSSSMPSITALIPPDVNRGVTPNGMSGYLGSLDWTKPTPLGGTLGLGSKFAGSERRDLGDSGCADVILRRGLLGS